MMRTRSLLLVVLLAAACSSAQVSGAPSPGVTGTWIGETYRVETADLIVDYPRPIDPAAADEHAATLQMAYESFRAIFAFDGEHPFGGEKTSVVMSLTENQSHIMGNKIIIGRALTRLMQEGYVNPPDPTFFHEMTHLFVYAQLTNGRHYFYQLIVGFNEGLADYMSCHPDIFKLWNHDAGPQAFCDQRLHGIGAKPGFALADYEARKIDPYGLDWGAHPPTGGGEVFVPQMLGRVSDEAGWGIWRALFEATKAPGANPAADEADAYYLETKSQKMSDPLIKKAFSEFIGHLGTAAGQDLRPMFRGWGFDL